MTPLAEVLNDLGATSGTVHRCEGEVLTLVDAVGIPADVLALIKVIPNGKGMAGEAWSRGEPVTSCNLPDDPSEIIQPGARRVNAHTAVAIPVRSSRDGMLAVVGFAFAEDSPLDAERMDTLTSAARRLVSRQVGALS